MAEHHILKIAKILDHGEASDGAQVGVKVADDKDRELVVLLPHAKAGEFALRLAAGAAYAAEKRGEADRDTARRPLSLTPKGVDLGQRGDGTVVLALELADGFKVQIPLPDRMLAPMRDGFAKAVEAKATPASDTTKH
jgi:hypothetical protein